MGIEVRMPRMSDSMEEGKVLRWLKKPGDRVEVGDVLAEIETDKADMELEAFDGGILDEIVVEEGNSAGVGDVLAKLRDSGSDGESTAAETSRTGDPAEAEAEEPAEGEAEEAEAEEKEKPREPKREAKGEPSRRERNRAAETEAPEQDAAATEEKENGDEGRTSGDQSAARRPAGRDTGSRVSPAARKMADERGVDVSRIRGSGPAGRVVQRDVRRSARTDGGPWTGPREQLSNIRRTVAHRMAESKRETPHFYVTVEVDMEACARLRDELREAYPKGPSVNFTHFLVRATALALGEHPRINARYVRDDAIEFAEAAHIGLAVALDEGLLVAVLHDCETKDLFETAKEGRELVERVRAGRAQGDDLTGGTFTISNLGMFPIEEFAAVINPPQSAVLAVGAVVPRAVVRDGEIVARRTMRMTLSSDHRVIDGVEAARFLATLQDILEHPVRLVVGERG